MPVDVFARFWLQIPSGCAKIRYKFIKSVDDEEEEYAAGGGIERGFIGWENLAPCRGRSLLSWIAETALCFEPCLHFCGAGS